MTDYKEYAKQMRENAVKNEQGNIVCSSELWEEIANLINRLEAENERLQKYYDDMQGAIYSFREDHAKVKFFKEEIKAEARKEFAERLKELLGVKKFGLIDNILKEMESNNNGNN